MKVKRILSIILALLLTVSMIPLSVSSVLAAEAQDFFEQQQQEKIEDNKLSSSGSCGTNVSYTFNYSTGHLTISGSGAMQDYGFVYSPGLIGTTIYFSPFKNESSIKSIQIHYGVTSIGNQSFVGCINLQSVIIPSSLKSIGNSAFSGCSSLQSVTIPGSVTNIGDYAFDECTGLQSITVDTNNQYYSSDSYGVLYNKDKTKLIQYPVGNKRTSFNAPSSLISIDGYAFRYCTSLQSITIGNGVTSIGHSAFSNCTSLQSITIPDSVVKIGKNAFRHCGNLEVIKLLLQIQEK